MIEEETIKDHVHQGDPLLHIELHIFQSLVEGEGVAPKIVWHIYRPKDV